MISIYILWLLIFLLVALLLKLLDVRKNYIICFFITIFIIIFVINLKTSIESAINGAKLVVTAILPTIFPFSVICNLLICYDGITLYSKILGPLFCSPLGLSKSASFPIAASFICGYPLGAKYCSDIYNLGYIHKDEYERLLNIASNAGPIFILGSVAVAMLNNIKYGYILLIANYLSVLIIGLITKKSTKKSTKIQNNKLVNKSIRKEYNFGINLKTSIEGAINTTLNVGAFVIIFSVIINIIKSTASISDAFTFLENSFKLPTGILYNLFLGSIEFTNGSKLISDLNLSISLKLSIISFILCFSSLSVIAQVSSIVSKDTPNFKKYILLKLLQGIIGFVITFISSNIILVSIPTFSIAPNYSYKLIMYKIFIPLILVLSISLLVSVLLKFIKGKLHSS
ncbi:sporulation integral membrane protein YlbJ [Clostridium sp. AL.422]|uniref:sporulation integral membrane protein YlbJ n=1 Tax=Clostridium TaxID=1485 RepID=UPI00293DA666|nr:MULTISPECIES: sporulation integral membrane protein YlbJ [unclassified Clostridium]MDV4151205.1 sporulation integral membrane protein YlbJ [Clostridium sp. AL.422]